MSAPLFFTLKCFETCLVEACGMLKHVMLRLAEASDCGLQRMLRWFRFAHRIIRFFAVAQNDSNQNVKTCHAEACRSIW